MKATDVRDAAMVFWPALVTPIVVAGTILLGAPWIGAAVLTVIRFLPRYWWSCLFGPTNGIVLAGGIFACLIPYVAAFL